MVLFYIYIMKGQAYNKRYIIYNRKILKILSDYIEKHPYMRFTQILWNLGLEVYNKDKDLFYQESKETLDYLKK